MIGASFFSSKVLFRCGKLDDSFVIWCRIRSHWRKVDGKGDEWPEF